MKNTPLKKTMRKTMGGLMAAACAALATSGGASPARPEDPQDAAPKQEKGAKAAQPVVASAADVESVDAILAALYDVISGEKGVARDWDRFESLFHPKLGRLVPFQLDASGGEVSAAGFGPAVYAERSAGVFERTAFYEVEIDRRVERFGGLVHVWSTYEGRLSKDAEPAMRGINSIQLMNDGKRWWILSVVWEAEREGLELPAAYLPK